MARGLHDPVRCTPALSTSYVELSKRSAEDPSAIRGLVAGGRDG
jgi:hypothetical protein